MANPEPPCWGSSDVRPPVDTKINFICGDASIYSFPQLIDAIFRRWINSLERQKEKKRKILILFSFVRIQSIKIKELLLIPLHFLFHPTHGIFCIKSFRGEPWWAFFTCLHQLIGSCITEETQQRMSARETWSQRVISCRSLTAVLWGLEGFLMAVANLSMPISYSINMI